MSDCKTIKPAHSIHLTESAQFYGIVIGPETLILKQNDCILSFYNVWYRTQEEIDQAEEEKKKEKEAATHRSNAPQQSEESTPASQARAPQSRNE